MTALPQVHLHPAGRDEARRGVQRARVHLRRALARPVVQAASLGVARLAVHPPGAARAAAAARVQGALTSDPTFGVRGVERGSDATWRVQFASRAWYRHACAAGAVGNALMMVSANMVGFVVGTDGMKHMIHEIVGSWAGLRFLVSACVCIFVAVQLMFEYR